MEDHFTLSRPDVDPLQGIDAPDFDSPLASRAGPEDQSVEEVHIRIQQRNGRKSLTIVQGLPKNLNMKKVLQYFKKAFCCNGTIVTDETHGNILQLTGDQRKVVSEFLVEQKICPKDKVKIHGVL